MVYKRNSQRYFIHAIADQKKTYDLESRYILFCWNMCYDNKLNWKMQKKKVGSEKKMHFLSVHKFLWGIISNPIDNM